MRHQHLQSIHALTSQFGVRIVDVSENSVIVEISGKTTRVVAFLSLAKPFGIIESAETDSALSIKLDDDGTYDVGVHIHATSVYLDQRIVPVLSPALSEELCSLNPVQERLASSVIPTMTRGTKVIKKWFGKTVIKHAFTEFSAKLSYSEAQGVIEDKPLGGVPVMPEHNASAVEHDIRVSQDLAKELQTACFTLDDSGIPIDCSQYEHRESNQLVEEVHFHRIWKVTHASLTSVVFCNSYVSPTSPLRSRLLSTFLSRLFFAVTLFPRSFILLLTPLVHNIPIERRLHHYTLKAPLYSHFTPPIRRYEDVLVHHQLESVLQGTGNNKFSIDRDAAAKVTQQCNIKRDSVKPDQEQSVRLYLCVLISDFTSPYGSVVR
ncbi:hypothetical protein EW146_g10396 [Bondarzewia mesenterica]|uniref:RNB domain-containing protein n=1 Tax=Bondarzewia mesenterica TaxID=1095465 RepID=A0A4S4KXL2_9AGAM|nr:hypothetical protein EW146_g10396 [Bondarzewia mesenterica]